MRLRGQGAQAGLAGAGRRLTLPKGKKDDRLDHEELEDGAIRAEQLPGGKVEEEEGIEGQADGDVVDDGHVEVAAGDAARTGDILGLEQTLLSNKGPPSPLALPACPSARLSEGSLSRAPRATDRSGQNTGGRALPHQLEHWGQLPPAAPVPTLLAEGSRQPRGQGLSLMI